MKVLRRDFGEPRKTRKRVGGAPKIKVGIMRLGDERTMGFVVAFEGMKGYNIDSERMKKTSN